VLLWFAGASWVIVWQVFQDPAIDYRLIIAGALLPDLVDGPFGGARLLHTLLFSVALLAAVMLATRHRRLLRRRLLALPIGTFIHLILDGMWARTKVFWWPLFGRSFGPGGLPSFGHPVAVIALEELAGVAALWWCWQRFELRDRVRRAHFMRTGRLGRQ
jgi:membrane-bound metal-dependent hydrolase YbcI (DUF457 family)